MIIAAFQPTSGAAHLSESSEEIMALAVAKLQLLAIEQARNPCPGPVEGFSQ
jgi:hypothetical protein